MSKANRHEMIDKLLKPDDYPDCVKRAVKIFNATKYKTLIANLPKVQSADNGVAYAVTDGASKDTAFVMFCPFANGLDGPNMLLRGQFISLAAAEGKFFDDEGRTIPLVVLGSPSGSYGVKLSRTGLRELSGGDPAAFCHEYLQVVKGMGFNKIALY